MTWPSGDQYIGDWENNQRFEYGEQSIYLEISINAAKRHSILLQHLIDWKYIGLDMVFTCTAVVTDIRANMWLAGRSTLFISCVIIVLESVLPHSGWFLEFLYRPYSGGFWSVLVDDWDTRRGEVCRPICRWEKVKGRCFCLKRCEQTRPGVNCAGVCSPQAKTV